MFLALDGLQLLPPRPPTPMTAIFSRLAVFWARRQRGAAATIPEATN